MSESRELQSPTLRKARDIDGRVRRYMPVVFRVAERQWERLGRRVDRAELVTAGAMALLRAAESHDEERAPFTAHLQRRLQWAMKDVARRRLGRTIDASRGVPSCAARRFGDGNRRVTASLDTDGLRSSSCLEAWGDWPGTLTASEAADDLAIADDDSPETQVIRRDLADHLCRALRGLDHRERRLVERHYLDGERFAVVAEELGISPFAACRMHRRALEALERALAPLCAEPPLTRRPRVARRSAAGRGSRG